MDVPARVKNPNPAQEAAKEVATMQVLSINVALPKTVLIDGEKIATGIFKKPVAGPVQVRSLNLDGDCQADLKNHGGPNKAVYAYPLANIEYWRRVLARDDLGPGSLGENLTVEGPLETSVAIGDELEIGGARFLVTQPRIPCYKLAHAIGLPDFPKQFLASGRTGFYLRVLQEGSMTAGDAIVQVGSREPQRVTVAEIAEAYRTRKAVSELRERILNLKSLPPSWREWVEEHVRVKA